MQALAFCGIHVLSPRLLLKMTGEGAFSIIDTYSQLAALGENIRAFCADDCQWHDLGTADSVLQAARRSKSSDGL
jgi:NDP-sugar pyrophosphorylase family protein